MKAHSKFSYVRWALLVARFWRWKQLVHDVFFFAAAPTASRPNHLIVDCKTQNVELFGSSVLTLVYSALRFYLSRSDARPARRHAGSDFVWHRAGHSVTNQRVVWRLPGISLRFTKLSARAIRDSTAPNYDITIELGRQPAGLQPICGQTITV